MDYVPKINTKRDMHCCALPLPSKGRGEKLVTWNFRGKESKRKAKVKVHGWNKRCYWMLDLGGRAEDD